MRPTAGAYLLYGSVASSRAAAASAAEIVDMTMKGRVTTRRRSLRLPRRSLFSAVGLGRLLSAEELIRDRGGRAFLRKIGAIVDGSNL